MYLCFGTFATVLNRCRRKIIRQADLIARLAKCVDPNSSYIKNDQRYNDTWEIEGDGPAITKLLKCTINFTFSSDEYAKGAIVNVVIKNIETEVAPFIEEDKKAKVIFVLLNIIQSDTNIDVHGNEAFKRFFGLDRKSLLQQKKFHFSEFLGRTLLYTIYGSIDNIIGKTCVSSITIDYIEQVFDIHDRKFIWEPDKQTLTLTFGIVFNIFDYALQNFKIYDFIQRVDPVDRVDFRYIENCERFLKYTEENIWNHFAPIVSEIPEPYSRSIKAFGNECKRPHKNRSMKFSSKRIRRYSQKRRNTSNVNTIIYKVQQFAQALDEYTTYLGFNMRPLDVKKVPDTFVPICYKDTKEELDFDIETKKYREQLVSIGSEIRSYAQSTQ